ncbi:MAG TPA: esterase-like activity of phytase family protein [Candidatus Competibacteraceae bacterium]|nr:esterase-like activity of phytase family protein [Candidatus Competibacteraceae bacterium]
MLRLFPALLLIVLLHTGACAADDLIATPLTLHEQIKTGASHAGVRLLGTLRLNHATINGQTLCGLSGLAWDESAGLLYALSDRGVLFHLRPGFDADGMLDSLQAVAAYPLRDEVDKPLRPPLNDSEALGLERRDGQPATLLVSFEIRPRVVRYDRSGHWLGEQDLPMALRDLRQYRDANQALEALAIDPRWGFITGTEAPRRDDPPGQVRIFTRDGLSWRYPLGSAPNSALVDMVVLDDGRLLTLERAFTAPLRPLIISLRRSPLPAPSTAGTPLTPQDVAVFDSSQGWLLDNFEGLSHYREQRFFMVSDDNCNSWQNTLLVQFELLPAAPR